MEHNPSTSHNMKLKKSKKTLPTILAIVAILLLAVAIIFAAMFYKEKSEIDDLNSQIDNLNNQVKILHDKIEAEVAKDENSDEETALPTCVEDPTHINVTDCSAADKPTANELIEVYKKANNTDIALVAREDGVSNVKNSPIPSNQVVTANLGYPEGGGFLAVFYRVDSNSPWRFGFGTQQPLLCSDQAYGSTERKKAFAALGCYVDSNSVETTTVGKYFGLI